MDSKKLASLLQAFSSGDVSLQETLSQLRPGELSEVSGEVFATVDLDRKRQDRFS